MTDYEDKEQPDTKCYQHRIDEGAEALDLSSKQQVTKLCKGKKDNEEHDAKSCNVFRALKEKDGKLVSHTSELPLF